MYFLVKERLQQISTMLRDNTKRGSLINTSIELQGSTATHLNVLGTLTIAA